MQRRRKWNQNMQVCVESSRILFQLAVYMRAFSVKPMALLLWHIMKKYLSVAQQQLQKQGSITTVLAAAQIAA